MLGMSNAQQCCHLSQAQPGSEDAAEQAEAAGDLATIPLGGTPPASPSAASAASAASADADWTIVEVQYVAAAGL